MPDCYVHGSDDSLSDNSSSNSSDLSFYLTVYGSLGAANTVRCDAQAGVRSCACVHAHARVAVRRVLP